MPIVRLTAFFRDNDGHGWSETHEQDGGSSIVSLGPFLTNFNNLMKDFRRPLLAGDANYMGCRASYAVNAQVNAGDNIALEPPINGPQTFNGNVLEMTAPEAAVKMRIRNAGFTAKSDIYLRGFWSQVAEGGVVNFATPVGAQWKTRADIYAANLVSGGYGWAGTNNALTSRGNVIGFVVNANGTVTVSVLPTNNVPLPAANSHVPVKFARINGSKSIMNRSFACVVQVGGGSVTTTETVNPTAWVVGGSYIATVTGFIPYAAVSYYKLSSRKTGRIFGVGPGRAPVKILH